MGSAVGPGFFLEKDQNIVELILADVKASKVFVMNKPRISFESPVL